MLAVKGNKWKNNLKKKVIAGLIAACGVCCIISLVRGAKGGDGQQPGPMQDAAGFLTYYDEIFTESFKTKLDQEAEQELFCSDGMISFGTGMIWFFPSSNGSGLEISTVNGLDGCSVRYGGQ